MVRIILKGGLGNQMFQYALGKSVALKYDVPLFLDLSFLKTRIPFKNLTPLKGFTYREYDLDIFGIKDTSGTIFNNSVLDKYCSYLVTTTKNRFLGKNYIKEGKNPYKYYERALEGGSEAVFDGFWHNYRYFETYKKEICTIFDIEKLFDEKYKDFEDKIVGHENSVAVHLRRGDYSNKKHKSVYVELTKNYYMEAINQIKKKVENPHFFVFGGEDESWIKSKLGSGLDLGDEFTIVSDSTSGYKNRSHFRFISLCKHAVISNSSYSWWAAYLNKNENKIVMAPDKWMPQYEFENVENWISLEV